MGLPCWSCGRAALLLLLATSSAVEETAGDAPRPRKCTAEGCQKAKKPENATRLEAGCRGCFPKNRKECEKDLWVRCCNQEISCHDDHCRAEVLGKLKSNAKVRVHDDFESDDEDQAEISRGMTGKVLKVDADGDAFIKFWRDELDDEYAYHWVFKRTGWDNLELPGSGAARMRAARTVTCLDRCMRKLECIPFPEASKKQQKTFQKCAIGCKVDDCNKDEECKPKFEAYAICKQGISSTDKCNTPVEEKGREAEL